MVCLKFGYCCPDKTVINRPYLAETPLPHKAPYRIELIGRDGASETLMDSVSTEHLALTNATLMKRGAPGRVCVIRDESGKAIHRF